MSGKNQAKQVTEAKRVRERTVYDEKSDKFVEATCSDSICAMFYLQKNDWNLEKSVDDYLSSLEKKSKTNSADIIDKEHDDEDVVFLESNVDSKEDEKNSIEDDQLFKLFKIISWNIDGLDITNLKSRSAGIIENIEKLSPDVVLFQEVTDDYLKFFNNTILTRDYKLAVMDAKDRINYFICIYVKKKCQLIRNDYLPYSNTVMGRYLQKCQFKFEDHLIEVINTHLESTKEYSESRITQFAACMKHMKASTADLSVLAGDFNIRENEIKKSGGIAPEIKDCWSARGGDPLFRYTWDSKTNSNIQLDTSYPVRCRFDRMYFKESDKNLKNIKKSTITLQDFVLCGRNLIKSANCFASDHWGIFSVFRLAI